MAPVINLMDALRKSIRQREGGEDEGGQLVGVAAGAEEQGPERKGPSKSAAKRPASIEDKPKRRRVG